MKKRNIFKLLSLGFSLAVCIVACDKNNDDNTDDNNGNNGDSGKTETPIEVVEPSVGEAMSQADQKEYLETVALEFMDLTPASDYKALVELGEYVADTYEDYDWDNVEDWAEDAFEATREALGIKTIDSDTSIWTSSWDGTTYTFIYNDIYTNYKALLLASNFTGHFTANNGKWMQDKANDLQFIFTDKQGQQCVAKLETIGSVKKVYAGDVYDNQDHDYDDRGNISISNEYYDRIKCTIGVPEKIVATLTQGGKQVVKTTVNINLDGINNDEFDISKSSLSISASTELNNGYKIEVQKVAYTGNTNASASCVLSKDGKQIVSMGAASDVNALPSVNVSAFSSDEFDEDDYNWDDVNGKKAFVKLDILGKVQMQGTISDIRKFVDYIDAADDNDRDERNYKSYINQANALMDVNLFYDGKNVKQASTKLEPFADEDWNGRTEWDVEPVIYFFDGTSYSTFEAFFNERDFKKTIDAFEKLIDNYADLTD